MWLSKILSVFFLISVVTAQIPSFGYCPEYQPMSKFNMNRFLGQWHEAERYFTVTELASRCVTTNYEKMPDGRVWVSNEIRNTFTGVKRVLEGQLQVVGRDGEGKLSVKYTSLPVPYDTQYSVLDTDYDNYAVVWSCSGIGPVHTQSAWIMTRERLAPGLVLQRAYGVLDKFKISRAFFVKTNQDDCTIQPAPIEAVDPTPSSSTPEKNVVEEEEEKAKDSGIVEHKEIEKKEELKKKEPLSVPELIKETQKINEDVKPSDTEVKPEVKKDDKPVKSEEPVADVSEVKV